MLRSAKIALRRVLPAAAFDRLKMLQRRLQFARRSGFSDEEAIIAGYLDALPLRNRFCVDIAAQDGIGGSQTLALFKRGWEGIAVEYDARMFAILAELYGGFEHVNLVRTKVTPETVVDLLRACGCPRDFAFLSLDIDSYDYFVLERVLDAFRPSLMCVEINEIVPPPLRFTVTYRPDHTWDGNHFQGQSIAQCHALCQRHGYDILQLHYNNLLLAPRGTHGFRALGVSEAYDAGYRDKPDRRDKFPWNAEMEPLLVLSAADAVQFLDRQFARYAGRYELQ